MSDQAFVDGDHGEGICISLSGGKIKAPFDGKVTGIEPDRPAVRLLGSGGIKLLIKAGIEDNIPSNIFKMHIRKDQKIRKGDLLFEIDLKEYRKYAKDIDVALIILNSEDYLGILPAVSNKTDYGDLLITTIVSESI